MPIIGDKGAARTTPDSTSQRSNGMKQNNLAKLLGIALVVAIIATGVFYGLFVNKLSSSTGSGKMVVVAAKPIPVGTVLAEKDVQSIPWPVDGTPVGAFDSTPQVAGHTVL